MTESAEIRVGDTEREAAMTALGEHMSAGRLDVDEYGERAAKVAAAKTRGELLAVFTDLPDPRPVFGPQQPGPQLPQYGQPLPNPLPQPDAQGGWSTGVQQWQERPLAQRLATGAVPLAAILATILFFTILPIWWVFLLPAAAAVVSGAILGDDRHSIHQAHRMHREAMRQVHQHQRDAMRHVRHSYRHDHRRDRRRDLDG